MEGEQGSQNIRVLVRLKPVEPETACCISAQPPNCLNFDQPGESGSLGFEFDRVLDESASQDSVFQEIRRVVRAVLTGHNGTILSYGQTGSGKTHTLIGDIYSRKMRGVVPRSAAEIFSAVAAAGPGERYVVRVSAVEIYCERIRDLLDFSDTSHNLTINQESGGAVSIAGAKQELVSSEAELLLIMQTGLANRAVAATGMNAASSRSHCLVVLFVQRWRSDDSSTSVDFGKLCLVDLAGSERQDRTNAAGQTLEEGKLINKSLSALGNVVSALSDSKKLGSHVPFRDSKLTRALQDSLGGGSLTALIVCCSPAQEDASESLSALRFGARAAGIVNSVQTNSQKQQVASRQLEVSIQECRKLQAQLSALRLELEEIRKAAAPTQPGGRIWPSTHNPDSGRDSLALEAEGLILLMARLFILVALALMQFMP